jgi:cytochrome c oxidase subunit 2
LKVDAIPGRLNRVIVKPLYVGVALGNCYELCGYGHRVIPINVLVVPEKYYLNNLHKDLIADHPLK